MTAQIVNTARNRSSATSGSPDARPSSPTMTELAVARAVARLDGTVVGEREQVVPPRLVVRGTTAPPSA